MKDEPSQVPADIRDSAERLAKLIKLNKQFLHDMRVAATAEAGRDYLLSAWVNQLSLSAEMQAMLTLLRVGQMPQIAVVATRQAVQEFAERRLTPAELRSLHRAGDHTLDDDSEQQLSLEARG